MSGLNMVAIIGRLGKDPELRQTPNGKSVCDFSLAMDIGFGEQKKTLWMKVNAWGRNAEFAAKYFKKGKPMLVTGRLDEDKWNDKETGKERSRIFITADKIDFVMGDKADRNGEDGSSGSAPEQTRHVTSDADDIPF